MKKAGFGDQYLDQLGPWRQMLALGLTTWAEKPEPTRSDCHAWSAHPNFDLLATVAGIEPARGGVSPGGDSPSSRRASRTPGYASAPSREKSAWHTSGRARASLADVVLPEKLSGWFYWEGKRVALHGGRQHLTF